MNDEYQFAKQLNRFEKVLMEAILNPSANSNGLFLQIRNSPYRCFEKEGNTVYFGVNVLTFIKGYAINFWIGMDITAPGNQKIAIYFPENNPDVYLEKLKGYGKWQYSLRAKVSEGFWLNLQDASVQKIFAGDANAKNLIIEFFNEPLDVLSK